MQTYPLITFSHVDSHKIPIIQTVKEIFGDTVLNALQIEPSCSTISILQNKFHTQFAMQSICIKNIKNKYYKKYYNKLQYTKSLHFCFWHDLCFWQTLIKISSIKPKY